MTLGRLVVAVLVSAGWSMASAGAEETGRPMAVAVPVSDVATAAQASTGTGDAEGTDEQGRPSSPESSETIVAMEEESETTVAMEEEEYVPLDLPESEDGESGTDGASGAPEDKPAVEPAVLGLDEGAAYFVHAEIVGVPNSEGMVSASLCTRSNFTKSGCRTQRVAAREGQVSITFNGVAPGHYAVQVHHDENGNGKMDFTFFGLPKEPYGFSRDAKPVLAPPKFDSASFEVKDGDISLIINLQNT